MITAIEQENMGPMDLVNRVRLALGELSYHQLDDISCNAANGIVVLTGDLRSYYLKQIAQAIAMRVPGVRQVQNEIRVID